MHRLRLRLRACADDAQPGLVRDILAAGTERARAEADATMALVRDAMGMFQLQQSK